MKFKPSVAAVMVGAVTFAGGASVARADSDHTVSGKVTLISEYEYRGLSQTSEKPALQLNLDYAHKSGFYLGAFLTNIKWIKDTKDEVQNIAGPRINVSGGSGGVELDLFGGYKMELAKDLVLDLGYLRYEYPGANAITVAGETALKKPNTDELYVGLTYTDFNVKYSQSTSDLFGFPNTKRSSFVEVNWSKQVVDKLTVSAHLGSVKVKNAKDFDYVVYRVGATYDYNGWLLGAYVKGTDAKSSLYTYKGKDWSKDRLVVSVAKTF
jgi:uncharacterized protein (TIGR02001 family)